MHHATAPAFLEFDRFGCHLRLFLSLEMYARFEARLASHRCEHFALRPVPYLTLALASSQPLNRLIAALTIPALLCHYLALMLPAWLLVALALTPCVRGR